MLKRYKVKYINEFRQIVEDELDVSGIERLCDTYMVLECQKI